MDTRLAHGLGCSKIVGMAVRGFCLCSPTEPGMSLSVFQRILIVNVIEIFAMILNPSVASFGAGFAIQRSGGLRFGKAEDTSYSRSRTLDNPKANPQEHRRRLMGQLIIFITAVTARDTAETQIRYAEDVFIVRAGTPRVGTNLELNGASKK